MFIEREGKQYELTEDELWQAYREHQLKNITRDLEDYLGTLEDDDIQRLYGLDRTEMDALIPETATTSREYISAGMSDDFARDRALEDVARKHRVPPLITKEACRAALEANIPLDVLFAFSDGQDCQIFKSDSFEPGDVIIYIPDMDLNEINTQQALWTQEELDELLSKFYTGNDFMEEVRDSTVVTGEENILKAAEQLWEYVDWQHPSTALPELQEEWIDGAEL